MRDEYKLDVFNQFNKLYNFVKYLIQALQI